MLKITIKLFAAIALSALLFTSTSCSRHRHAARASHVQHTESESDYDSDSGRSGGRGTIVKMERRDGVLYVPVKINDVPMDFIFDTGASSVSLSLTEAEFLFKQGKLDKTDFRGTEQFQDATGSISVGMKVNLRKVSVGGRTIHNVEASVVGNQQAPLLLGQTVMQRFGKVLIDYDNNTITLE